MSTPLYITSVIALQARNAVRYMIDDNDQRISDKDLVNDMVVTYYQDLLGSENSETHPFLVDELRNIIPYRFPSALTAEFIAVPSQEEVTSTLFSRPKNKAPGPDGFPGVFWEAWTVVGSDTIATVQEFFTSRQMLRSLMLQPSL